MARTLGTLLKNGVPLLTAIAIGRNVLGNTALAEAVDKAGEEVKTGGGLAFALARASAFPKLALQMISVGEESGALDDMLLKVADTFDVEAKNTVDRLLAALVPVLTRGHDRRGRDHHDGDPAADPEHHQFHSMRRIMQMYKSQVWRRALRWVLPGCRAACAGFTLIEMMVVLVLIGVVMAIVGGTRVPEFPERASTRPASPQVHSLEMKVQAYVLDNGSTPQSLNDLVTRPGNAANWNGPYAKPADLKDPFGHPFQYKAPGDHGDFDIIFLGKDGAARRRRC